MAEREPNNHLHFIFQNSAHAESFTPPRSRDDKKIPDRERAAHGSALLDKLQQLICLGGVKYASLPLSPQPIQHITCVSIRWIHRVKHLNNTPLSHDQR